MDNICVLMWFFYDYLERCRQARTRTATLSYRLARFFGQPRLARVSARFAARFRYVAAPLKPFFTTKSDEHLLDVQSYLLPIQVDKLLGDVRSFLDSVYALMLVFTPPEVKLTNKVRESFGKFADRHDANNLPSLALPLTLLEELIPWGQTVRKMRDDYIHRGKSSIAMPRFGAQSGTAQVYFNLHRFSKSSGQRDLPNALYATDNPNDLLDLELLVLYIVVPVFALRCALGESLQEHYSGRLSEWKSMDSNSWSSGGGISVRCAFACFVRMGKYSS